MNMGAQANYGVRNFAQMDIGTRQLVMAIMGKALPETDKYIIILAKNLNRSDLIFGLASKIANNESLILDWVSLLNLVFIECLHNFHLESYEHMLRVRRIIQEIKIMLAKHDIKNLPDYGIRQFNRIKQHLDLAETDWVLLEHAACFHDLGKMAFPLEFWNTPGKFTEAQRFFYLGEFLDVNQVVVGLSVLHHHPNLCYPKNGIVKKLNKQLAAIDFDSNKFQYMLELLITVDIYEGISGVRSYRKQRYGHEKTLTQMAGELGKIGESYIPFLQAVWEMLMHPKALCVA
jgi:hypothetical protein